MSIARCLQCVAGGTFLGLSYEIFKAEKTRADWWSDLSASVSANEKIRQDFQNSKLVDPVVFTGLTVFLVAAMLRCGHVVSKCFREALK